jgi:hypothetical protein
MFVRAAPLFDIPEITGGASDLVAWRFNRAYRNENRTDRQGVCYMLRKGRTKPRIPATEVASAIQVDGLSHTELNDVFNRCETFYSYDEATMYSQYAAVCGCTSIVVPGMFRDREEWVKSHKFGRFGIAYGASDEELQHARATRETVAQVLQDQENESIESVKAFVSRVNERFP